MVFVNGSIIKADVPALMICVGDKLKGMTIISTAIQTVSRKGLYPPFTTLGTIVVNGVKASC